jgi:hypothetical protein
MMISSLNIWHVGVPSLEGGVLLWLLHGCPDTVWDCMSVDQFGLVLSRCLLLSYSVVADSAKQQRVLTVGCCMLVRFVQGAALPGSDRCRDNLQGPCALLR